MTWAQIRTLLRRQLQEVTAQAWQDTDLDVYLQIAYNRMQREILKIDRMAFRATELINLTADTTDYTLATATPIASLGTMLVERRPDTASSYVKQTRKDLDIVRDYIRTGASTNEAVGGLYAMSAMTTLVIYPAPLTALTAGVRLTYVPHLTQGMDADSPALPIQFHDSIATAAKIAALGETYQDTQQAERRWAEVVADLYTYFSRDDGENPQWRPSGLHEGS